MRSGGIGPPVALAIDVFARNLAEVGRADDEDLEALRPGLVASPRTRWDSNRVPLSELDDLVIASFNTGPGATTLPIRIYSQVRLGLSPEVNAASTILIAIVALGVTAATLLSKRAALRSERKLG